MIFIYLFTYWDFQPEGMLLLFCYNIKCYHNLIVYSLGFAAGEPAAGQQSERGGRQTG